MFNLCALRNAVLWTLVASGSLVLVEPAPYEALFAVAVLAFGLTLRFDRNFAPLTICLTLFNVGALLALMPWTADHDSVTFVVTSAYLSLTAIFFACVTTERSLERLEIIRRAYTCAAVVASVAGIAGYFHLGSLGEAFTKYDRATGTFKDPNVLGPFLVLALVWGAQRTILGEARRGLLAILGGATSFMIIAVALFLTFSRGAWGVCIGAFAVMAALDFFTAPSSRLRKRIIVWVVVGIGLAAALLAVALSFQDLREVFEVRFSFSQDYDLGATGRFGNQWRSLPLLLASPNGLGPLQFRHLFAEEDPHDVFVNAFASYGWIGGFAYCTLILLTIYVGFWLVFRRTPLQGHAIALWSCLFVQILQGFQIDTDHWRHFFLMLGCVWGLAAATRRGQPSARGVQGLSVVGAAAGAGR